MVSSLVEGSTSITLVTDWLKLSTGCSTVLQILSMRSSFPKTTLTFSFAFFANLKDIFIQAPMEDEFDLSMAR